MKMPNKRYLIGSAEPIIRIQFVPIALLLLLSLHKIHWPFLKLVYCRCQTQSNVTLLCRRFCRWPPFSFCTISYEKLFIWIVGVFYFFHFRACSVLFLFFVFSFLFLFILVSISIFSSTSNVMFANQALLKH